MSIVTITISIPQETAGVQVYENPASCNRCRFVLKLFPTSNLHLILNLNLI